MNKISSASSRVAKVTLGCASGAPLSYAGCIVNNYHPGDQFSADFGIPDASVLKWLVVAGT